MAKDAPVLPGLSPVAAKPVHAAFDGGRLTSDVGVLVLAEVERRLGIAERLARCLADPRSPERIHHTLAEMIRFRVLLIAAGYPDANDCDALRTDPAFKLALGRLPESGPDLRSQPTMSRLENLPTVTALKRMMAAMVELFCDSFAAVPRGLWSNLGDEAGGGVSSVMDEVTREDTPWRRIALSCCRGQERASRPTRCWSCCARAPGGC